MFKIICLAFGIAFVSNAQMIRLDGGDRAFSNQRAVNQQLQNIHQVISAPPLLQPALIEIAPQGKLCSCGHHYVKDEGKSQNKQNKNSIKNNKHSQYSSSEHKHAIKQQHLESYTSGHQILKQNGKSCDNCRDGKCSCQGCKCGNCQNNLNRH